MKKYDLNNDTLKLTMQGKVTIEFSVQCKLRAKSLETYLQSAFDNIFNLYAQLETMGLPVETTVFIDHLQSLANWLDQHFIKYLCATPLENFKRTIKEKTVSDVRTEYEKFMAEINSAEIDTKPELHEKLKRLTEAYIQNVKILCRRITECYTNGLQTAFLMRLNKNRTRLIHIHDTENDRHHQGKTVCIIEVRPESWLKRLKSEFQINYNQFLHSPCSYPG